MSKPWERRDNETAKAFAAFTAYRDLGAQRSLAKVGDKLGKSEALMERWSARHEWVMRAQAWDNHLDRQATSGQAKAVREMNERQAAIGVRLQAKAVEGLQQLPAHELSAGT
jgi:hypothetical protein